MNGDANVLSEPTRLSPARADHVTAPSPANPTTGEQRGSVESGTAATDGQARRCSPDPSHQTDKYRLVTPFWLRI